MRMKQLFVLAAAAVFMISCDNNSKANTTTTVEKTQPSFKSAYIDTEKLMKEYEESKQFEAKYKAMSERMQNELERDMKNFQNEVQNFQKNAQANGMEWAQKKEAELQRRQVTLQQKEQNYLKKFQEEGAVERDSMVSKMKSFIKEYGKEKGYDFIYGTGDAATVLYAKDQYDITEEVLKLMNEKYAKKGEVKKEEPKAEESKSTTASK